LEVSRGVGEQQTRRISQRSYGEQEVFGEHTLYPGLFSCSPYGRRGGLRFTVGSQGLKPSSKWLYRHD
jgi:hypothetical protein